MPFQIRDAAKADVRDAKRRRENRQTRVRLTDKLKRGLAAVRKGPQSFPILPDGDGVTRVARVASFPHLILFRSDGVNTVVIAVIDGRRGPEAFAEALARE